MDDNLKTYLEGLNGAFEEFKATNDKRLAEIEKKGEADPLVEEKLAKIEADLDRYENVNQKLVKQEKAAEGFAEKLESIEKMLKRFSSLTEKSQKLPAQTFSELIQLFMMYTQKDFTEHLKGIKNVEAALAKGRALKAKATTWS